VVLYEGVANPHGANCSSRSTEFTACLAQHVARTRDFLSWQEPTQSTEGGAPGNASIIMGLPDGGNLTGPDHRVIPGSRLDQAGDAAANATKARCRNQTDDINRSDMDMVTLPAGTLGAHQAKPWTCKCSRSLRVFFHESLTEAVAQTSSTPPATRASPRARTSRRASRRPAWWRAASRSGSSRSSREGARLRSLARAAAAGDQPFPC